MGREIFRRLIYTLFCFLIAACIIYLDPADNQYNEKKPLRLTFLNVDEWKPFNVIGMQDDIIESLSLDDYLFRSYKKDKQAVTLYVGYYRTPEKIGAAHSPLVCFPGQGWAITAPKRIQIKSSVGIVNSEKIIATKDGQQELIVYWFQAYDVTSSGTFMQKINSLWSRLKGNPADNAFVRVSVQVENDNTDKAERNAIDFIKVYYPLFLEYIKN
jgi:EpsI family protein